MIVNGQPKNYSGEGNFWGNFLMTVVCFLMFVGSLYAMSWWDFELVWLPGLIALGLAVLTYLLPQQLIGRSDSVDHDVIHVEETTSRHAGH
ncbi:hypothetical protein [Citricoccus sp. GCM10030269]|uniref:hypothetical protein n=1 Tax=Citricoccus sp. GCM10030269 TaxID=3273388 RepID=UPI003617DFFE